MILQYWAPLSHTEQIKDQQLYSFVFKRHAEIVGGIRCFQGSVLHPENAGDANKSIPFIYKRTL